MTPPDFQKNYKNIDIFINKVYTITRKYKKKKGGY